MRSNQSNAVIVLCAGFSYHGLDNASLRRYRFSAEENKPLYTEPARRQWTWGKIKIIRGKDLSLYHNCDLTTIRLRQDYDEKLTC